MYQGFPREYKYTLGQDMKRDSISFDVHGGFGKMYQLFGNDMNKIINELNEVLAT